MHQGGGRHRGKQHPSKDGNARQGKHQKPDTEQYTDPCGSTEGGRWTASGFLAAGATGSCTSGLPSLSSRLTDACTPSELAGSLGMPG